MIYIVDGPPGAGKSYFGTRIAVKALESGRRPCFTNYPVVFGKKSTFIWDYSLISEPIQNAIIIMDEAYRDVSSRDFKKFTKDEHTFFATNRHNSLDIYLIAQHLNRVDVIIREMANEIIRISKVAVPVIDYPLWFRADVYLDEAAYARKEIYCSYRYPFRRKYAQAYDTHFFRRKSEPYQGITWLEKIKSENIDSL